MWKYIFGVLVLIVVVLFATGGLKISFSTVTTVGPSSELGYYRVPKDDIFLAYEIDVEPGTTMLFRLQPVIMQHIVEADGWRALVEQPRDLKPKAVYGGLFADESGDYQLTDDDAEKLREFWQLEVGTSLIFSNIASDGKEIPGQYTVVRKDEIELEGLDEPLETYVIEEKLAPQGATNTSGPSETTTEDNAQNSEQEDIVEPESSEEESGINWQNTPEEQDQIAREFARFFGNQKIYYWYSPKLGTNIGFNFGESDKPFHVLKGIGKERELEAFFTGQRLANRYEKPRKYTTIRSPAKRLETVDKLRDLSKAFHENFSDTQNFEAIQTFENYEFFSLETLNTEAASADTQIKDTCESILSDLSDLEARESSDEINASDILKTTTSIQGDFIDFGCAEFAGEDLNARIAKEFEANKNLVNMPFLGGIFRELNDYNRQYYRVEPNKPLEGEEQERQGLILTQVTESGTYFRDEDLFEGDIITGAHRTPISTMDEFNAALIDWVATEEDSLSISFLGVGMSYGKNLKRELLQ